MSAEVGPYARPTTLTQSQKALQEWDEEERPLPPGPDEYEKRTLHEGELQTLAEEHLRIQKLEARNQELNARLQETSNTLERTRSQLNQIQALHDSELRAILQDKEALAMKILELQRELYAPHEAALRKVAEAEAEIHVQFEEFRSSFEQLKRRLAESHARELESVFERNETAQKHQLVSESLFQIALLLPQLKAAPLSPELWERASELLDFS